MRPIVPVLAGLACVWLAAPPAVAQHGRVAVHGRVVDEAGAPIAGATISVSSETNRYANLTTDASGEFVARVRPTPALRLAASHPSYGEQWTDMMWRGWSRYDAITPAPVVLTLRRGVVLQGLLLDTAGRPSAGETLLLVPSYIGSGPRPITTTTDANGRFTFPRAVLDQFELVPHSLDSWRPDLRPHAGALPGIAQQPSDWLAHARAGEPIELRITSLAP